MPEFVFDGTATWKSETECDLWVKRTRIATVSPPPQLGGKAGYCSSEEIFAASLASSTNTLYLLIARNSNLKLRNLETRASVRMNAERLDKLIFTNVHFVMKVRLEKEDALERSKAESVYRIVQKVCPIRQSWGEAVPVTFELNVQ